MKRTSYALVGVLLLAMIGAAAWRWWPAPPRPAESVVTTAAPPAAPPPAAAASVPAIQHPIEAPPESQAAAPLDLPSTLTALFGRKAVLSMFQLDDFPRRFVATVDNLGRAQAPARVWPLNPMPGRFMVERQNGVQLIGADNGLRYTPFVLLVETVDMQQAVAAYVRLYPLFQHAYEELGYPKGYFNDRLIDVIDQLLATPDPAGALAVHLPPINGPVQPERPWVLYEFDDPALQSLPAGQKILLRMGAVNERRIKARLVELRRLLTATPAQR